jgi:hypothetical protein
VSSERTNDQQERRATERFAMKCRIRYLVVGSGPRLSGTGITVNVSSGGMLIATEHVLSPGWSVEVEVDWPVKLDEGVPLKLLVTGRIVRSESDPFVLAGLRILRHSFNSAA